MKLALQTGFFAGDFRVKLRNCPVFNVLLICVSVWVPLFFVAVVSGFHCFSEDGVSGNRINDGHCDRETQAQMFTSRGLVECVGLGTGCYGWSGKYILVPYFAMFIASKAESFFGLPHGQVLTTTVISHYFVPVRTVRA